MSPRPPQADEPQPDGPQRDERLGAALSGPPVPDHGPTFWADLTDRLSEPTVSPIPVRAQGETPVLQRTGSAIDCSGASPASPERHRTRRPDHDH